MKRTLFLSALALTAIVAQAQDHPLVPRLNGSQVLKQESKANESYRLLVHPLENPSSSSSEHKETYLPVSGRITRVAYESPRGAPASDVFHYYEGKLQSEGFEILYNCAGQTCSPSTRGASFNQAMAPPDLGDKMQGKAKSQRYLAAKLRRMKGDLYEGDTFVSVYATRTDLTQATKNDPVYVNVVVIEASPGK